MQNSPGFTVYYLSSASGFTSPLWEGYPAVALDAPPTDAQIWLLGHGYPLDTDLGSDPNADGVCLLMAYALNLDPNLNLRGSLPEVTIDEVAMSMSFHAATPGITYSVETSLDLENWTTEGVTLSGIGPDKVRVATVGRESPRRYLRLMVTQ